MSLIWTVGATMCSSAIDFGEEGGFIFDKNFDLKMLLLLWSGDWLSLMGGEELGLGWRSTSLVSCKLQTSPM